VTSFQCISRASRVAVLALLATVLFAKPAAADLTGFLGVTTTPDNHAARGFAVGVGLLIVGFEFEYSSSSEDEDMLVPGLRTYSGNVLVQTPTPAVQLYGTVGIGGYNEQLGLLDETNIAMNLGGGAKLRLVGPLRLRLDYRIFRLQGSPLHDNYHRLYAGANIAF
jgi:opacity protein-like surface antigen